MSIKSIVTLAKLSIWCWTFQLYAREGASSSNELRTDGSCVDFLWCLIYEVASDLACQGILLAHLTVGAAGAVIQTSETQTSASASVSSEANQWHASHATAQNEEKNFNKNQPVPLQAGTLHDTHFASTASIRQGSAMLTVWTTRLLHRHAVLKQNLGLSVLWEPIQWPAHVINIFRHNLAVQETW